MNWHERTHLVYLALLRIYIGGYLLWLGIEKYQQNFARGDWIRRQIGDTHHPNIYGWYQDFLNNYVEKHQELFGFLVVSGEIVLGACLLLGLFTRTSAFIALFMLLNYYFGPGAIRGGVVAAQQQLFSLCLLVIMLSGAGRTLGLDGWFFRRH